MKHVNYNSQTISLSSVNFIFFQFGCKTDRARHRSTQIKLKYEELIKTTKDTEASYLKHYALHLNFDKAEDREFVDLINETCLPDFKSIRLENIEGIEEAKLLRLMSTPSEGHIQSFNVDSSNHNKYISDRGRRQFFSFLTNWAQKVQLNFEVHNLEISGKELSELLKASHNGERVSFSECKIDPTFSQFDFDIPQQYKVQHLHFEYGGREDRSDWDKHLKHFKLLLLAISWSGLASSLKWIYLNDGQLNKRQVNSLLRKYKIDHIEISM